jgi:uncharacterized membrane protein
VIQIIVVAGVCVVMLGLVWMVATLPATELLDEMTITYGFSADAAQTVFALRLFISALPLIIGFGVMAWGFVKNVEEREIGYVQM